MIRRVLWWVAAVLPRLICAAAGEITQWTQTAGAANPLRYDFSYDPTGQLLSAKQADTVTSALVRSFGYTYDAGGNRTGEITGTAVAKDTHNSPAQMSVAQSV